MGRDKKSISICTSYYARPIIELEEVVSDSLFFRFSIANNNLKEYKGNDCQEYQIRFIA